MSQAKLSQLRSQKAKLLADATALLSRGINTAASRAEHRKITDELDTIQFDIDSLERIERTIPSAPAPVVPSEDVERTTRRHKKHLVNRAWKHYFRHGHQPQSVEQRDLITTSDADGAALIPQEYDKAWTNALKFYGPIASLISFSDQASGRPLKRAVSSDVDSTMSHLPETNATSSLEEDPTLFSQITGVDSLVTRINFSYEEYDDSASPIEDFINQLAGIRVARAIEWALTKGTDNSSSKNVLPNSPAGGFLGGLTAGVTMPGASLGTVPSYAQLIALKSSVDMAYQIGDKSGFMVSPTTYNALEGAVTTTGAALYSHDPNTGLLLVANRPVYSNAAMPDYTTASLPAFSGVVSTSGTAVTWVSGSVFSALLVGQTVSINGVNYTVASYTDNHDIVLTASAGTQTSVAYSVTAIPAQSVLFGDFSRSYWYVNSGMRIKILTERAADVLERIALIYTRIGAAPLVSTAVKSLVNAAS